MESKVNFVDASVEKVWVTENAEQLIANIARVSTDEPIDSTRGYFHLFNYLIQHGHWSPFEMANFCVSIRTSRVVSAQLLRHRSFSFQEFSQRYSTVSNDYMSVIPRRQSMVNRQSSDEIMFPLIEMFTHYQATIAEKSMDLYHSALAFGVSKECARFLLPGNVATHIYMNGTVRSWIHYLMLRLKNDTQKEHRDVADLIFIEFQKCFPTIAEIIFNKMAQ